MTAVGTSIRTRERIVTAEQTAPSAPQATWSRKVVDGES